MKSLSQRLLASALLACAMALPTLTADARDFANWMADLPDAAYVATLSLPGAHDTATGEGFTAGSLTGNSAQAQTKSLNDIYNSGTRVLDFRPGNNGSKITCYHGVAEIKKDFSVAIRELCQWLDQHPTEFFVIHLYKASDSNNELDKNGLMTNLLSEEAVAPHIIQFKPDLTVGEMRGKIVFLVRQDINWDSPFGAKMEEWHETDNLNSGWELRGRIYPTKPGTTERYARGATYLLVQDLAGDTKNKEADKKKYAKEIFDFLSTWCPTTRNNMVWTFNFASGYQGGSSSAVNYANNANVMNPYFKDCLAQSDGPAGMVMIDFVADDTHKVISNMFGSTKSVTTYGKSLTEAVVEQNFKYIDRYVDRQVTGLTFNDHSWAGTLWDGMFYGNNLFADINSDGHMDYLITTSQLWDGGTQYCVTNNAQGGFNFMTERVFGTGYGNHVALPGDFDNDGDIDFVLLRSGGSAEMQVNDGNGQFTKIENIGISDITSISEDNWQDGDWFKYYNFDGRAVVLDVNHDGLKDIVVYGSDGNPKVHVGHGDGTFTATDTNIPGLHNGKMSVGDYDGDGFADIIITGSGDWLWDSPEIKIVLTRPDMNFEVLQPSSLQPYAVFNGDVMFVDMNMDGLLDVFVNGMVNRWGDGRHDAYRATLLINKGNDEFAPADVLLDPMRKCSADWADLTGNGRPDIVYSGENHLGYYTSTVINAGDGNYKAESTMDGHRASPSVATCDYRGVGRASVAVMGHSWDSAANQLFDSEVDAPAMARRAADKAVEVEAEATAEGEAGVTLTVKNTHEFPAGTRFNYVIYTQDGKTISSVPVSLSKASMLTADINAATTATSVTYPSLHLSDISMMGVQAIDANKNGGPLNMLPVDVTGVDNVSPDSDRINVTVAGNAVTVKTATDGEVKIVDMLGRTVAAGMTNTPITVAANGVYIVMAADTAMKIRI